VQVAVSPGRGHPGGRLQLDAGARLGRLRQSEISEMEYALGATLSIQDIMSINATAGSDRLSQRPGTWRAALGVSIALDRWEPTFGTASSRTGGVRHALWPSRNTRRDPATGLPR